MGILFSPTQVRGEEEGNYLLREIQIKICEV